MGDKVHAFSLPLEALFSKSPVEAYTQKGGGCVKGGDLSAPCPACNIREVYVMV